MSGNPVHLYNPSLRTVDFNLLAWKLWCSTCEQPLSLRNLVKEKWGERCQLELRCLWCSKVISVPLDEKSLQDEELKAQSPEEANSIHEDNSSGTSSLTSADSMSNTYVIFKKLIIFIFYDSF
jgi:hypothetical protein